MITLLAAIAMVQTPANALVGVWATANDDFVWVFENANEGRYVEVDKFGTIGEGKWVPNGNYFAEWSRTDIPGGAAQISQYPLKRSAPVARGKIAFIPDKPDQRGYPGVLKPEYVNTGGQVGTPRSPVTFVCPRSRVSFQGTYKGDGVTLRIDPPYLKFGDHEYAIGFSPVDMPKSGSSVSAYHITLTNPSTGETAGIGYMAWVPTPRIVGQLRRGADVATDRVFVAITDKRSSRWTYLSQ